MPRATKIVATIGPASTEPDVLAKLITAGVDVVRLNFSHGTANDHLLRADRVRTAARNAGREVAIMADLQGPKIRVGKFADGKVLLEPEAPFVLDAAFDGLGDLERVGLDYKELPRDVRPGDVLLLNDGLIELVVDRVDGSKIHTTVKIGGELSNNKGINRQGGGLTAPALTMKDMEDIKTAMKLGADYIAVSFPKNATDMSMARLLANRGGRRGRDAAAVHDREDRARRGDPGAAADPRRVRRHHGRARRPRGRGRQRRRAGAAEADDQDGAGVEQARDHGHPDDGVDDRQRDPDARRGLGRRERGARRQRRGDAVGRDGVGPVPRSRSSARWPRS